MTDAKPDAQPLTTEHVIVDGIEGNYARVELPDGTTADWLLSTLPDGLKEGDVLAINDHGESIEIDHQETRRRQGKAREALEALNEGAPAGDISL